MNYLRIIVSSLLVLFGAAIVNAQGANVAFGTVAADPTLPVEVTSDALDVNQTDGTALFTGDVLVGQGEMRMSAPRVLVIYNQEESGIKQILASGGVTLVSGPDAAEADDADYTIETGVILMTGNALLTQGENALTSDNMTINLITGTANMTGRVKTILKTAKE